MSSTTQRPNTLSPGVQTSAITSSQTNNRGYFPYIDGLRAIAVLGVLAFHIDSTWLPGGFVGVDVFFVISGFVISHSVSQYKGGMLKFFGYFYAKRIKRIFPALVVCLVLTSLASALFIPNAWLSGTNQQTGFFAFFGLSNFILAQVGSDYFAPSTDFNPYTQTWSLAVEEQFYVVFPFLLLPWLPGERWKRLSLQLFIAGFVLSLLYSGWQSQAHPNQAYFLSPGRFWELATGVIVYKILSEARPLEHKGRGLVLLGFISLIVLVLALILSSPHGFPVPGALPAVLATAGLIYSLHRTPQNLLHGVLGATLPVAIGKISYSLYLWHWPVFVLFRWTIGLESLWLQGLALALAFAMGTLSYLYVEQPVRRSSLLRTAAPWRVVLPGFTILIASAFLFQYIHDKQATLSLSDVSHRPQVWYPDKTEPSGHKENCTLRVGYEHLESGKLTIFTPEGCAQTPDEKTHTLFVLGDSHVLAYEAMLKNYSLQNNAVIYAYAKPGCAFISLMPWNENQECRQFAETVLSNLSELKDGDILFLPSLRLPRLSDQWGRLNAPYKHADLYGPQADEQRHQRVMETVESLRKLTDKGVRIVLEAPKPLFAAPAFRCADWFNRNSPQCRQGLTIPKARMEEMRLPILNSFHEIEEALPGISIWDPFPTLCPDETCQVWRDDKPLYFDGDHISGHANQVLLPSFSRHMNGLAQPDPAAPHGGGN